MDTSNAVGIVCGGAVLLVAFLLLARYFPGEVRKWLLALGGPSESAMKKQSEELLAQMDRNLAERKARHGN